MKSIVNQMNIVKSECAIGLACTLIGSFFAAATPEICTPPAELLAVDSAFIAEYRSEFLTDYERFWSASSDYIRCLDDERARALGAVKDSMAGYEAVFAMQGSAAMRPIPSGD